MDPKMTEGKGGWFITAAHFGQEVARVGDHIHLAPHDGAVVLWNMDGKTSGSVMDVGQCEEYGRRLLQIAAEHRKRNAPPTPPASLWAALTQRKA